VDDRTILLLRELKGTQQNGLHCDWKRPHTSGFVKRFIRTVKEEFFRSTGPRPWFTALEALQTALNEWLAYYNRELPHQVYRNMGRTSLETIALFLRTVGDEG